MFVCGLSISATNTYTQTLWGLVDERYRMCIVPLSAKESALVHRVVVVVVVVEQQYTKIVIRSAATHGLRHSTQQRMASISCNYNDLARPIVIVVVCVCVATVAFRLNISFWSREFNRAIVRTCVCVCAVSIRDDVDDVDVLCVVDVGLE